MLDRANYVEETLGKLNNLRFKTSHTNVAKYLFGLIN